jgi:hypothetical protein
MIYSVGLGPDFFQGWIFRLAVAYFFLVIATMTVLARRWRRNEIPPDSDGLRERRNRRVEVRLLILWGAGIAYGAYGVWKGQFTLVNFAYACGLLMAGIALVLWDMREGRASWRP